MYVLNAPRLWKCVLLSIKAWSNILFVSVKINRFVSNHSMQSMQCSALNSIECRPFTRRRAEVLSTTSRMFEEWSWVDASGNCRVKYWARAAAHSLSSRVSSMYSTTKLRLHSQAWRSRSALLWQCGVCVRSRCSAIRSAKLGPVRFLHSTDVSQMTRFLSNSCWRLGWNSVTPDSSCAKSNSHSAVGAFSVHKVPLSTAFCNYMYVG